MENEIIFILITDLNEINLLINNIETRRKIGSVSKMKIYVYHREGENIPHFHIKRDNFNDACLRIDKAEWFSHGKNDEILYKPELKHLYNWLIKNNNQYYKKIIDEWNKHAINKIDINSDVPKYFEL